MLYRFKDFENVIDLTNDDLVVIVIEHPKIMSSFISSFYDGSEDENHLFIDTGKECLCSKIAMFVPNPFVLSLTSKKLLSGLYKHIVVSCAYMADEKVTLLNRLSLELLADLEKEIDVPIDYDASLSLENILQTMNVRIVGTESTRLNCFIEVLRIYSSILKLKIFFVSHLSAYFDASQLAILKKEIAAADIKLIDIEIRQPLDKFYDHIMTVDADCCEF